MPRVSIRATRVELSVPLLLLLLGACDAQEQKADGFKVLGQTPATESSKKPEPPLPDPAIWQTPLADPDLEAGRLVWTGTCIRCHSTGLGGAPLIGNADLWQPRIDQGLAVLFDHATKGFYGKKGEMPARGGNDALSDEDVRRAVRFMASRVDPSIASR